MFDANELVNIRIKGQSLVPPETERVGFKVQINERTQLANKVKQAHCLSLFSALCDMLPRIHRAPCSHMQQVTLWVRGDP